MVNTFLQSGINNGVTLSILMNVKSTLHSKFVHNAKASRCFVPGPQEGVLQRHLKLPDVMDRKLVKPSVLNYI